MTLAPTNLTKRLLQSNDDLPNENEGTAGFVVVPFILFFLFWNSIVAHSMVPALSYAFRGECHPSLIILFFPHWIVGIAVPALLGYEWNGILGLFAFLGITVVLPYSAILSNFLSRNFSEETTNERNENASTPKSPTLEDLLIIKKVLPVGDQANNKKVLKRSMDSAHPSSYRSTHPKSHIYARTTAHRNEGSHRTGSVSVQLCAICLEEYQAGERIAWSRNDACHHVFHRHCALQHLQAGNEACPICRNSYHVMVDVELGDTR